MLDFFKKKILIYIRQNYYFTLEKLDPTTRKGTAQIFWVGFKNININYVITQTADVKGALTLRP